MAKKVLLKNNSEIMLPITRGELVLDSSGGIALRSTEFLATDSCPGLTLLHHVEVSKNSVPETSTEGVSIIQLKSSSEKAYPVTSAEAVVVVTNKGTDSLANVINEIYENVNNSKTVLDERPTEGNTTHSVSSDGIFQELKETVGNIQTLLQKV
jgi:hypothetical protein